MRIVFVHSRYRSAQPSGENVAVDLQIGALRKAGHDVLLIGSDSDDLGHGVLSLARSAAKVATGTGLDPLDQIIGFDADVIHVHNLFPNFSTRWIKTCPVPIVSTLHNFRYCCAAGTLYRNGAPCDLCLTKTSFQSVKHGCYRGSAVASVPMAIRSFGGARNDALLRGSSVLVTLSLRARKVHLDAGVDPGRLRIVPNFSAEAEWRSDGSGDWIYAGRLAPEKGILELLSAWPKGVGLNIFGDGPLRSAVENLCKTGDWIRYAGNVDQLTLRQQMGASKGLVFPSRWPESATPMVYVEALGVGLPVIALKGNGAADDVAQGMTGISVDTWESLSESIDVITRDWHEFSASSLERFRLLYSEAAWVTAMEAVYAYAVESFERDR